MADDFESYVTARQRALVGFAFLLTGDHHGAEDLVQIALAKAYLRWEKMRAQGSAEGYVRRIIVNENASIWRRAWKRNEHPTAELPDRDASPPDESWQDDMWAQLSTLPRGQRAVLVLRYYEDLTEAQTAEILGCSVGTVKSQAFKALASLRRRVEPVNGEGEAS